MTKAAPKDVTSFAGFPDQQARFFRALARNQNREWFLAHKQEYEHGWAAPLRVLLEEVLTKVARAFPEHALGDPKVFRIFRDVRFARDKSPYKTHVAGYLPLARAERRLPGPVVLYLHLGLDTYVGAGQWMMDPAQLERYRAALLDERRGAELTRILARLAKAGFTVGSHDSLKKVPRGVDPEHPRAELLKRKGLVVEFPGFSRELIVSRALVDWLAKQTRTAAPLVEWLARTTG